VYGASVDVAPEPVHGQVRNIRLAQNNMHEIDPLWNNIADSTGTCMDNPIRVTRYHSLHVFDLNGTHLIPTSLSDDPTQILMSMRHEEYPHFGVQFHPESIGTNETGKKLLQNFVTICSQYKRSLTYRIDPSFRDSSIFKPTYNESIVPSKKHYGVYIHKVPNLPPNGANMRPMDVIDEILKKETFYFWLDEARSIDESRPGVSILGASKCRVEYWGKDKDKNQQGVYTWDDEGALVYENRHTNMVSYLQEEQSNNVITYSTISNFTTETLLFETLDEVNLNEGPPFDFRGGYVGYFGYEVRHDTKRYEESNLGASACMLQTDHTGTSGTATVPTAAFIWADKSFVFDHQTDEWYLVAVHSASNETSTFENSEVFHWMKAMSRRLTNGLSRVSQPTASLPWTKSKGDLPIFTSSRSQESYNRNFESCLNYIRHGESYELCLTNQFETRVSCSPSPSTISPLGLYRVLRRRNPAPFSSFFHWNPSQRRTSHSKSKLEQISAVAICCTSPERFVSVKRKRQPDGICSATLEVEAKPIKGTIQRILPSLGRSSLTKEEEKEDQELAQKLQSSVKDRAENLMIVDLLRNDMSQVCETGSVHVSKLMNIESYATVHQMVSTIRGTLSVDKNAIDVIKACFPGGSMTGAPKTRTMELLHEIEDRVGRGPYSGCLGYISLNGCMDMNIVIRTAIVTPEWSTSTATDCTNGQNEFWKVSIGAGGAITALSQRDDEYNEMKLKSSVVVGAVEEWAQSPGDAFEVNTMSHRVTMPREYN
jgi:para-aminobenzoate synthetase